MERVGPSRQLRLQGENLSLPLGLDAFGVARDGIAAQSARLPVETFGVQVRVTRGLPAIDVRKGMIMLHNVKKIVVFRLILGAHTASCRMRNEGGKINSSLHRDHESR